jgi:energy-converting hydrogenase Eha subunit G
MASGYKGRASASDGCALFLAERDISDTILHVWAGIAGRDGIKPDTFYTLSDGKPVEA